MDLRPATGPLAQPSRARLFSLLCDLRRPASTSELASELGLHRNGVRLHLEQLERAGLVERRRERQVVGRPSDRWSVSPSALPEGEAPTAYRDLGRWLVRAMAESKVGLREIEAVGRSIGADLAASTSMAQGPEARMYAALVALGFQPSRELDGPDRMAYCLNNCPYREVAAERQAVVCTLHRGITRGLLKAMDPGTRMTGFVIKDPETAGCRVELRGPITEQAKDALAS